jgi:hypothetical protein
MWYRLSTALNSTLTASESQKVYEMYDYHLRIFCHVCLIGSHLRRGLGVRYARNKLTVQLSSATETCGNSLFEGGQVE